MRKINLSTLEQGNAIMRILHSALDAADPAQAIRHTLRLQGKRLIVYPTHKGPSGSYGWAMPGVEYDLSAFRQIPLLSFGKAGWTLARALDDLLGGFTST